MYRIVVAHDLSVRSEIALVRAAQLAVDRRGRLTILHVLDSNTPHSEVETCHVKASARLKKEVGRWIGDKRMPCTVEILTGDPASVVARRAQAHVVNLTVAGRHCRRPIADVLSGRTVERLMRQSMQPVLVVNNTDQSPYNRVLIPVEFSQASKTAIQFVADFLPETRLHLLHAYKRPFQDDTASLSLTFSREEKAKFATPLKEQANRAVSVLIKELKPRTATLGQLWQMGRSRTWSRRP